MVGIWVSGFTEKEIEKINAYWRTAQKQDRSAFIREVVMKAILR